jgi:hypothetical protein
VGWKWLRHDNILPFLGVTSLPQPFRMVSPWMENGNIMRFLKNRLEENPFALVSIYDPTETLLDHDERIAGRCRQRFTIPSRSRFCSWRPQGCKAHNYELELLKNNPPSVGKYPHRLRSSPSPSRLRACKNHRGFMRQQHTDWSQRGNGPMECARMLTPGAVWIWE